jgi:hypothetical protein
VTTDEMKDKVERSSKGTYTNWRQERMDTDTVVLVGGHRRLEKALLLVE